MKTNVQILLTSVLGVLLLISSSASAEAWARSYSNRLWGNWSAGGSTPWFAGGGGTLRNGGFPRGYPSFHRAPGMSSGFSGGAYIPRRGPVFGGFRGR